MTMMPALEIDDPAPGDARSWNARGAALTRSGEFSRAAYCFEQATALDPMFVEALNNLAVTSQRLGDPEAALRRYREALHLDPENTGVQFNLAVLYGLTGRLFEALAAVEMVSNKCPHFVPAILLGCALECEAERPEAALVRINKALDLSSGDDLSSDHAALEIRRAEILIETGDHGGALGAFDRILASRPGDSRALQGRALALQGLDRCPDAIAAFEAAEAASDAPVSILAARAWLHAEMGQEAEALALLGRAIARQSSHAGSWAARASLVRFDQDDPAVGRMEALAREPGIPARDRTALAFALGKTYLEHGEGARAFPWLREGNQLKRQSLDYDPGADVRHIREITAVFSDQALAGPGAPGLAGHQPIFVFGMPRSGTTLLDQMLASHPDMRSLGEPPFMAQLAGDPGFPAQAAGRGAAGLATLGADYLARSMPSGPDHRRTVDKTPSNVLHAGLIALMLPGAKMIHCRRDPFDTCLSLYSLQFKRGYQYCYDLGELGAYYRLYLGLMAHWRRVLPTGRMLETRYEDLVRDPGTELRKILDFLELPFDPACLRPHEAKRRVTSASLADVRAPVSTSRIGRAQAFLPWLGALGTFDPAG